MNTVNLSTINSIPNLDSFIIAKIRINEEDNLIINSYDDDVIVVTVLSKTENNRIFILRKVVDFYIKEKEIIINDENISKRFGENVTIRKYDNNYIIAISDTEYLSSDKLHKVGCVFLYTFKWNKGWTCIKQLTLIDGCDENKYSKFGGLVEFVKKGMIIGSFCNNEYVLFLFETDNFLHFHKQRIENNYNIRECENIKPLENYVTSNGKLILIYLELTHTLSDGSKEYLLKHKQL